MATYLPGATDFTDTRATSVIDLVVGPRVLEARHQGAGRRGAQPVDGGRRGLLAALLQGPRRACEPWGAGGSFIGDAIRSTNGSATDGATAMAIGSANGVPGSPVTTAPASAATSAPAAWSQRFRCSS